MHQLLQPKVCRPLLILALLICSWGFLKDVSGVPSQWVPNDKVMHHLIFLVLMLLWQASFPNRVALGIFVMALYGGLVEIAQATLTNRMGDWWDWLADLSGVAAAWLLWRYGLARFSNATS